MAAFGFDNQAQQQMGGQQQFGGVRGSNQMQQQFGPAALIPIGLSLAGMFAKSKGMGQQQPMPWDQVQQMFGPQALAQGTNTMFNSMQQQPGFAGIMGGASTLGNQMNQRLQQNIGSSGLTGTPMAGMMKAAGLGYGGQLRSMTQQKMWQQAQQMAMQNMMMQSQMFGQNQQNQMNAPNFWSQFGSSLLGAGAQGFAG